MNRFRRVDDALKFMDAIRNEEYDSKLEYNTIVDKLADYVDNLCSGFIAPVTSYQLVDINNKSYTLVYDIHKRYAPDTLRQALDYLWFMSRHSVIGLPANARRFIWRNAKKIKWLSFFVVFILAFILAVKK